MKTTDDKGEIHYRAKPLLFWGAFCLAISLPVACRSEVASSAAVPVLPQGFQSELQGMPPHWPVVGSGGAVSTANPLATAAAIDILKAGGNAIDALIAVQWVLAVVEPQSSGLGGGGFLVYYDAAKQKAHALDGREEKPAASPANLFLDATGKVLPFRERIAGARAVGVPGTVALMDYAYRHFGSGKQRWQDLFVRAIELAESGFRVSPRLAQAMALSCERLLLQNGGSSAYLRAGKPYQVGEAFYQRDLAKTLRRLSEKGAADFYTGTIAQDLLATVRNNRHYASVMSAEDLAAYRVVERPVISGRVGRATLYTVGAPASGDSIVQILQKLPLPQPNDEKLLLRLLALEKNAFAVREKTLEDPDFAAVGKSGGAASESENTTHVSIIDAAGNAVSYTASIEMSMGSALEVRGRGFLLNNQLSDFEALPGRVNSPEPGQRVRKTALNEDARILGSKRPKSSMAPLVMRFDDGRIVALGSPGGATIVGTVALSAARILSGVALQESIHLPRAVMMPDGTALVELPLRQNAAFLRALAAAQIAFDPNRKTISLGSVQAVECQKNFCIAASDLRREGLGLVPQIRVD